MLIVLLIPVHSRIQGGSSSHRPRGKSLSVQKGALVGAVISRSLWWLMVINGD